MIMNSVTTLTTSLDRALLICTIRPHDPKHLKTSLQRRPRKLFESLNIVF